jgi:MscS family membrane protein
MLDKIYYGNSVREWGISLLIIIGALLINKVITILHRKVIKRVTAKSTIRLDDIFFDSLEKPILLGVILLAIWIAVGRLDLGKNVHETIGKAYDVLVVLNVTWFFARLVSSLIEEVFTGNAQKPPKSNFTIDTKLLPLVKRGALIFVWFIGIVMALHNVGITVTALIGTLGIGGIAFALAAQDTIKNMFGGITIFTDKTFRIGDIIKVDSNEGVVIDIGLRSTRIRTYDKRLVTIPNYKLMDAVITNISSEPARRIVLELGLTYDTPPAQMQEAIRILKDMPNRIPGVRDKDFTALFSDFGDSALVITYIYFIRKSADIFDTRSAVNFEILRAFTEAGLSFAFPSRTVYLEGFADHGTAGRLPN